MTPLERETYVALGVFMWLLFALAEVALWFGGASWPVVIFFAASGMFASGRFVMRKGVQDREGTLQ